MKDFDFGFLKQMASRFNPIIPTGDVFLDGRYNWQATTNGVEWPYYRFFYHLSELLRPDLVVELGGFQGTAAAHFAKGWPLSDVITIDHHTDPGDEVNKVKMEEVATRYSNLRYIQGWTTDAEAEAQIGHHGLGNAPSAYPEVVKTNQKIDILFIDSWHVYDHARLDWAAYAPLLGKGPALVICDDILDENRPGFPISGMREFWEELPEPKFLNDNLHPASRMGFLKII